MTRASVTLGLVGITCAGLVGCSSSSPGTGVVQGRLPLCYGPGPGMNLEPHTTIQIVRDGLVVGTRTFASSDQHRTYRLALPAGTYVLKTWAKPDLHVVVQPGKTLSADFRFLGCL